MIDEPLAAAKKYGLSRTINARQSAIDTINKWGNLSLEEKKAKLEYEIKWVEQTKKYATWELSSEIYKKELKKVNNEIEWNALENEVGILEDFNNNLPKKDAEFTKLLIAVKKAAKGDKYSDKDLKKLKKAVDSAKKKMEKLDVVSGETFDESNFTKARKDKALWGVGLSGRNKVDETLRPLTSDLWATATAAEKRAATAYTEGSGGCNRPLRGYRGSWNNFVGEGKVNLDYEGRAEDIKNLTKLIDRSKLKCDVWLTRGWDDVNGVCGFLKISHNEYYQLKTLSQSELSAKFVGKVYRDTAFLSCGTSKGDGFSGPMKGNIYCPKGSKAIYAEPFSVYNGDDLSSRNYWDGKTKYPFKSEFETILQKGGRYRCTKVYFDKGQLYMDFDLIGQ